MTRQTEALSGLHHNRSILLRVIQKLDLEALDFLLFPETKSIGELLMHVAGFEYAMVFSLKAGQGQEIDFDLWEELKPGFSREAGFSGPSGFELDIYTQILAKMRARTVDLIEANPAGAVFDRDQFEISTLMSLLAKKDGAGRPEAYEKLGAGIGTSFVDDGVITQDGTVNLAELLQLHETYHRGQITFQTYLMSRLDRQPLAAP
ncbi:MAG: hypothetical protein AAGI06_09245 [Pseudomonadota bacterium]